MKKNKILREMKLNGHRSSKTRDILASIFNEQNHPLTVPEILGHLNTKGESVNKTTIYREIEKLVAHSILKEVHFGDDKTRYELANTKHHHHIVCATCRRVDDVVISQDVQDHEEKIAKKLNYKVLNHSLEFFGVCKSCQ